MPGEVGWPGVCMRNPHLPLAACSDLRGFLAAAEPPCQRHVCRQQRRRCSRFPRRAGCISWGGPHVASWRTAALEASQSLTGLFVLAGDPPTPRVVAPPTEEALQQLSKARGTGSSGHPPRSEVAPSSSSVAAQLSHSSSTLTNGSSIYTVSMSSTDTVLPRMSGPATAQSGSLRKRPAAETASSVVSTRRPPCPDAVKAGSAPPALSWT